MEAYIYGRARRKETDVEEPMKRLMQELGNAVNDSIANSDRIAEAIDEIKRAGYDVFMVLEATIGFSRRDNGDDSEPAQEPQPMKEPTPLVDGKGNVTIKFTQQDQRFLKALKITPDKRP